MTRRPAWGASFGPLLTLTLLGLARLLVAGLGWVTVLTVRVLAFVIPILIQIIIGILLIPFRR